MSVLKTLFDFRSGELERIPYLLYSLISLTILVFSGSAFVSLLQDGGALMVVSGVFFAFSLYVTFALTVQRVRHIGLESPALLVLSFFALMTLALFVMPLDQMSQIAGQELSSPGGVEQTMMYAVFLLWGVPGAFLDKKPLHVMFCEAKTGQLRRLPFFGYTLFVGIFFPFLMYLILIPFQMLMVYSSATIVMLLGALVLILSALAYGGVAIYANAVLTIKRMRNIGFKRPILYFWLYIAFVFITLGVFVLHAVMTLDFKVLQETKDIAPLIPYFIWGGIYYLILLAIGLFLLFAPEGTLNSPKKLKK